MARTIIIEDEFIIRIGRIEWWHLSQRLIDDVAPTLEGVPDHDLDELCQSILFTNIHNGILWTFIGPGTDMGSIRSGANRAVLVKASNPEIKSSFMVVISIIFHCALHTFDSKTRDKH
jgi:hypothetical protein